MRVFVGKWITNEEFRNLKPRNVFHKQLEPIDLPCDEHRNRHILFRSKFNVEKKPHKTKIYISADDYYKLYINGKFVCQGPAPSYHSSYNYNAVDIGEYLLEGENLIAVHTLYQGLINRVWQSGDNRHGLILDVEADGETILSSDDSFKTAVHTGFREIDITGIQTQFLEEYNSNSFEVDFYKTDFDDSNWANAKIHMFADYTLKEQNTKMLEFEKVLPVAMTQKENIINIDFGSNYVGYLCMSVNGHKNDIITVRCGQELTDQGEVRYELRANCKYEETWILADGESILDQFDYKSFRYAQVILPKDCTVKSIHMMVRHYPFKLTAKIKKEFQKDIKLKKIWDLCVHTQKYGVQEVIQDCMEREKGFYVGDGCYTALTNMVLTGDDSIVRKLIDDGFTSSFITPGLVTCLDCSFMQEIAEYPLILISLVLWHYRIFGDVQYLKSNYPKIISVLESYRVDYEKDGLLRDLDKWCVVEWPKNFRDNYDVDITEGQICHQAHVSINAYYIEAVKTANKIAHILKMLPYRDEKPLTDIFIKTFYNKDKGLFKDGESTNHISVVGNVFPFAFGLCPDHRCTDNILNLITQRKISSLSFFCTFPFFQGLVRYGKVDKIKEFMSDEGAWLRMLNEDATTTFEGWGKDTKWNTSLFHLTFSYGALFLADIDLEELFI